LRIVLSAPWAFVFGCEPGWVYPSIRTGLTIAGSPVVGVMVHTPLPSQPAPVTPKAIVSRPAAALASRIAWRSEPAPESLVLVTVKVAASIEADASARPRRRRMAQSSPFAGKSIARGSETLLQAERLDDEGGHLSAVGRQRRAIIPAAAPGGDVSCHELVDPRGVLKTAAPLPPPVLVPSSSIRWTELSGRPGPFVLALEPGCV
jgi:hypothetical protein